MSSGHTWDSEAGGRRLHDDPPSQWAALGPALSIPEDLIEAIAVGAAERMQMEDTAQEHVG
jgi:hypothetical protein